MRALLAILVLSSVASAAALPELPAREATRIVAEAGLDGAPYTVETGVMQYTDRVRWLIKVDREPLTVARLCFRPRITLGVWVNQGGAYVVYGRQPVLAV